MVLTTGRAAMAVLLLSALCLAAPARAQSTQATPAAAPAAPPSETVSTHEDWTVRCQTVTGKRGCEAVQTLQTADLKGILAHVAVRVEKNGPVHVVVLTPPGVWLPANITFKVAGVPDITLTYKRCGQHCVASTELKPEELEKLRASNGTADMVFEDGSRRAITLPLSFKGLGDAIRASMGN